ncbi:hypothetical protein b3_0095 [Synechococcus phage B3]|nr:hypothetical protein b3_0095 [Synechococcus phage B3]QGT54709.1 hypothetical protein b23_0094 [Synechococcus phage B23]
MKLYLTYEDKGPKENGGQDCYYTSCWRLLYILKGKTYQEIKDKVEKFENQMLNGGRLSPKIKDFYWENEEHDDIEVENHVRHL